MLSSAHRLRAGGDITSTTRRGQRVGSRTVLVHVCVDARGTGEPVRVAFVAGKRVGPSVVRNRVKRRLRALMRERVGLLPGGTDLVVRALPRSAEATSPELGSDLDRVLRAFSADREEVSR